MNLSQPTLAQIVSSGRPALMARYGAHLQSHHWQALTAIEACRTGACGERHQHCPACGHTHHQMLSCGHRSCPQCQHHTTTAWFDRQRAKRLPVDYFMVTFTLPSELRGIALRQPRAVYNALFSSASSTLRSFGKNSALHIDLGLCAVLHTHNRRLDFHPHLHVIVPGGGIHRRRRQWKKLRGRYLFNTVALGRVFRARMLAALAKAKVSLPDDLPAQWVVHCANVGAGEHALQYLSRYLYQGVIAPKNLVALDAETGTVTFAYTDAQTKARATRTLPIADFLWRLMSHVLPPGLRRSRDYGFLHSNAKRILKLVQLILRVLIAPPPPSRARPAACPVCKGVLTITVIRPPRRSRLT
jgi:hypothetical protein